MSQAAGGGLGNPQSNSEIGASEPETPESESGSLPTVEERVSEFVDKFPDLAEVPISETDGQKLREELAYVPDRDFRQRRAVTWEGALRELLEWNEDYRDMTLRFEKGKPGELEHDAARDDAEHSYHPDYTEREYAQLQGFARELAGGERPTGGEASAAYEDPYIAFLSLTTSSTPDGDFAPPVDHDRRVVDAWTGGGDDNGVYHSLRYVLGEKLGVPSDAWEYHRQGEPHAGGGVATGYRHDHPMVVFDAAHVDGEPTAEDFRPVVAKHVEKCEGAEWSAHEIGGDGPEESAVVVEPVGADGVADVAGYMAKYVSFGDEDLAERELEYIAYATTQWATNSQKYTRSDGANHAIRADACKQAYEDPASQQERAHGETVVRSTRRGCSFECACCGSPWKIDQDGTLTEHRRPDSGPEEGSLRASWPSARAAARVGGDAGPEGFEDPPEWRLDAVIDSEGEEHPPVPGGPVMVPLRLENWASKPPPSQDERRRELVDEASDGVSIEVLLDRVDCATEHDVEKLLERGELYHAGGATVRAT